MAIGARNCASSTSFGNFGSVVGVGAPSFLENQISSFRPAVLRFLLMGAFGTVVRCTVRFQKVTIRFGCQNSTEISNAINWYGSVWRLTDGVFSVSGNMTCDDRLMWRSAYIGTWTKLERLGTAGFWSAAKVAYRQTLFDWPSTSACKRLQVYSRRAMQAVYSLNHWFK